MSNLQDVPEDRRCNAKTRAGTPCMNWSMRNGRCRMQVTRRHRLTPVGSRLVLDVFPLHVHAGKDQRLRTPATDHGSGAATPGSRAPGA